MLITSASLSALRVAFSAAYQGGLDQAPSQYQMIATTVPSSTGEQRYGWLGKVPSMREWVGQRALQNIAEHDYSIRNKTWESTIPVGREDIEDDNLGQYQPLFAEMGRAVGALPDQLCFGAFKDGFNQPCYDRQNYFDTDHPVILENGTTGTVANTDGGTGTPWFLICADRAIKPIIWQTRRAFTLVQKDRLTDDNVFDNNEFVYGTDGRANVGYGFWQMAWGSKQPLNATTFTAAFTALTSMKGDYGRPLGLRPTHLVVPPSLEFDAERLMKAELIAPDTSNILRGKAEVLVSPWLA